MMKKKLLSGLIKRHPDGFGFFIPEQTDHPDVYVPRHSMKGIMTNDRVMIEAEAERGGDRFRGEIVKVVSRGTKRIVGTFRLLNDKTAILRDEGGGWGEDLKIKIEDSMNAKEGELVAAEILQYADDGNPFLGRVCEIIGDALEPMNDIKRVILASHIPEHFTEDVLREAKAFSEVPHEKDFAGRVDLRGKNLITIDGVTAKDFDDAVLVEKNSQGFLLYVAIADVSHYVQPGTAIDKSGYERGTSVYFPNYCVPMLPEVLSNGLCSLKPHVPRLCLVAEMQIDFTGEVTSSKFYEAVMESKARVTYGKAQEIIDGTELPDLAHVAANILLCADLAKILMAKRFKEGSLDLEIPETELEIDASGVPIDVIRSERLFSHRLIEEMMLAANVAVAKFLGSRDIPAMYRIHEPPNEQALSILEKYLAVFGGRVKLGEGKLQMRLTKALQEFEGRPESEILNILTLRSMSQAKYHQDNVGHFGLGFEWYTHFTSPIRRYPDLIVHRLVKSQILKNSRYHLMPEDELATAGTWLSACEQRSAKAERQVKSIKKARFAHKFIGQEFNGIISSVTKFGVFVLLREYDFDGLIKLEDLSADRLEFDEESIRLVSKNSNFAFSIGDQLKVVVAAADPLEGRVNFALAEPPVRTGKSALSKTKDRDFKKDKRGKKGDRPPKKGKRHEGRPRDERSSKGPRTEEKVWSKTPHDKKKHRKGPPSEGRKAATTSSGPARGMERLRQAQSNEGRNAPGSSGPARGMDRLRQAVGMERKDGGSAPPAKSKSLSEFVDNLIARKTVNKGNDKPLSEPPWKKKKDKRKKR